jgi:hypothetical protein
LDSGNGAISLLIWTAIQHAAALGLTFNTDGLNSKNNLLLLTGFGGVLKPRYFVSKTTEMYQTAQFLKGSLHGLWSGISRPWRYARKAGCELRGIEAAGDGAGIHHGHVGLEADNRQSRNQLAARLLV